MKELLSEELNKAKKMMSYTHHPKKSITEQSKEKEVKKEKDSEEPKIISLFEYVNCKSLI